MKQARCAFGGEILMPEEVKLLRGICARIASQRWFPDGPNRQERLAAYILSMYLRGLVFPDKLEEVCTLAARLHYAVGKKAGNLVLHGQRFLVVEDEALLARDALRRLTAQGATVAGPVGTVAEALLLLETAEMDAALLDITLDGESVFPVAEQLRQRKIPFAFVTGLDRSNLPPAFKGVPIFPKPADWATVASSLVGSTAA